MRLGALLGIVALVPAAFNIAPANARRLSVPLCAGDGLVRTVTVPVSDGEVPGKEAPGCCAKACHTGSRKKALSRQIDKGQ